MARFSELKDIERPGSLQALVCGLVLVNVVGIACVLPITSWSGVQRIVIVLLIVGPLFAAFRATQRQTVVIASYAMFWALVIGITHGWGTTTGQLLSNEHLARLLVVAIGDVFSIALARLRERSERTNAQLTAILDSVPLGLGFLSNEFRFVRVNDTYAQLSGHEQAEYFGQLSRELFPQLGQETLAKLDELMFQALSGSSLVADDFSEFGDRSGEGQTWRVSFFPVKDKLGQKLGLGSIVEDVSERARRTRAQRRTQARAHFLAQASVELTRSVDYVETLPRICQLITDHQLADICLIDIIDGAYLNRQAAVDRTGTLSNRDLSRRLDVPSHLIEAMTLGTPILCNPLDPETAADILLTESPGERGRSALLIPLITSGRTLGVMSWLATSQERQFGEDDRMFAEEVGSHVAALIEQARLYRESTRLAQALQENLLPPVPGLELAARYPLLVKATRSAAISTMSFRSVMIAGLFLSVMLKVKEPKQPRWLLWPIIHCGLSPCKSIPQRRCWPGSMRRSCANAMRARFARWLWSSSIHVTMVSISLPLLVGIPTL
jgi:PAS domain S-box-containing protein